MTARNILMAAAGASTDANYIEDVFSTWLYTGNGGTQTITNGIDLAGKGGLVWVKSRTSGDSHGLWDTARGAGTGGGTASNKALASNLADAQGLASLPSANSDYLSAFGTSGFTVVDPGIANELANAGGQNYASWTFRKQPKFFDVVTYTGDGTFGRAIAHNLQSTPGALIIKATSNTGDWLAWCRTSTSGSYLKLNSSAAEVATGTPVFSSFFSVGTILNTNQSGVTYVAYLFAHDAGGFGLTGTDNVISCGSFTTDASSRASVSLGYEPQFLLVKSSSHDQNWLIVDNMRGWPSGSSMTGLVSLSPNTTSQETSYGGGGASGPTATGFNFFEPTGAGVKTYIYIAIRRGPMKVPTTGTSVFSPQAPLLPTTGTKVVTNFPVDLQINFGRSFADNRCFADRLRGLSTTTLETSLTRSLVSTNTDAEVSSSYTRNFNSAGYEISTDRSGSNYGYWNFRRAPGFFDEVCYTGTGVARTVTHNLAAVPELMIVKSRSLDQDWPVYTAPLGATQRLRINQNISTGTDLLWNNTSPTASLFSLGTNGEVNGSGATYVAYLFASCPGVSKVGSYTGNGSSQTINCSFTAGARFIMIKRTDSTGDWYVWDTARGIVTASDPRLSLNTTTAEVTTDDSVDPASSGFIVNQLSATNINVSAASYIFLAIA